ncbi:MULTISPECIES: hypothetical protein [unclassified Thalassospira]|uniref:hypothetical protein n=1 Tax=unclassified Thalassospira TaxID=2648997 RepID=UPI000B1AA231|nr:MULTISPECIES: hypothetical protein [unclassified Thalassospira]MBO9506901.1 hypothetical protein [Thalassospira sp. A3_1]
MFNNFFSGDPVIEKPRAVYAKLDKIESLDGVGSQSDSYVYFDTVDADWFNRTWKKYRSERKHQDASINWFKVAPISIIVGKRSLLFGKYVSTDELDSLRHEIDAPTDEIEERGNWYLLEFANDGIPVDQYFGLFSPPVSRVIASPQRVSAEFEKSLGDCFDLDDIKDATVSDIKKTLNPSCNSVEGVAVYDVGQGNCNALLRNVYSPAPTLYFDFGGGALANQSTFPTKLRHFCKSLKQPVILSHWDWDHWSSAQRDSGILQHTWIVPRQTLGAVHRTLAANIDSKGKLLIYPNNIGSIRVGSVELIKCQGRGRNHSGLALIATHQILDRRILLPGDARYNVIPNCLSRAITAFTALVAPHHGADMRFRRVPGPDYCGFNRIVYSYGPQNTFYHPRQITIDRHKDEDWDHKLETAEARKRSPTQLGHLLLTFDNSYVPNTRLFPPCGGNCQLDLVEG